MLLFVNMHFPIAMPLPYYGQIKNRNITLGCDRSAKYRNRVKDLGGARKRTRSSRLIECPFRLYGKRLGCGKWALQIRNPYHSHQAEDNMITHPVARHLITHQLQKVYELSEVGSNPRDIISLIRKEDPDTLVVPRDVYNI